MIILDTVDALRDQLGQEVAVSDWIEVGQGRINQFAEATEDRQWIHLDRERASRESPYKSTIAHGFLTLSLVSVLTRQAITLRGIGMAVNYGLNRVRFMAPVLAGQRIRGRFSPLAVDDVTGSVQVTWRVTIEGEGNDKPCCVAEWVVRYYPKPPDS
jgi:acyl dehydratase